MQSFSGADYLRIDIANAFGNDKLTWQERINWFMAMEEELITDPAMYARGAKEPAQALAGILAYLKYRQDKPTGYLCGLDATASGLQLLSILAGCEASARTCNLIDTGRREDAYAGLYEAMNARLETQGSISQPDIKRALMTTLYGSKAVPREVFGEDTPELRCFYETAWELMPGAMQLNEDLLGLWSPDTLAHSWVMPDGFDVVIKVEGEEVHQVSFLGALHEVKVKVNKPMESGLSLSANVVHSVDGMVVREMLRRCSRSVEHESLRYIQIRHATGTSTARAKDLALLRILELYDQSWFMPAVVLEYLDELNVGHLSHTQRLNVSRLIQTLPTTPFQLVAIHDCFKFPAMYGNIVRRQYLNILAELADSNILSMVASQIANRPIHVNKKNPTLSALINQAEYALS